LNSYDKIFDQNTNKKHWYHNLYPNYKYLKFVLCYEKIDEKYIDDLINHIKPDFKSCITNNPDFISNYGITNFDMRLNYTKDDEFYSILDIFGWIYSNSIFYEKIIKLFLNSTDDNVRNIFRIYLQQFLMKTKIYKNEIAKYFLNCKSIYLEKKELQKIILNNDKYDEDEIIFYIFENTIYKKETIEKMIEFNRDEIFIKFIISNYDITYKDIIAKYFLNKIDKSYIDKSCYISTKIKNINYLENIIEYTNMKKEAENILNKITLPQIGLIEYKYKL